MWRTAKEYILGIVIGISVLVLLVGSTTAGTIRIPTDCQNQYLQQYMMILRN